jgi:hypothetical protein
VPNRLTVIYGRKATEGDENPDKSIDRGFFHLISRT